MSFIELNNILKQYKTGNEHVVAVKKCFSFEVEQGEFLALMGESGSGKSTLLTIIGGLNKSTCGSVIIDEIDVYNLNSNVLADFRKESIGFLFQSFQLIPYLSVLENVVLPLVTNSCTNRKQIERAALILRKVYLENKMSRLINELSGGE